MATENGGIVFTVAGYTYDDPENNKGVREFLAIKRAVSGRAAKLACQEDVREKGKELIVVGVYEGFLQNRRDSDY